MKQYESYKPSGVEFIGDIPEHWEVRRLKYCMRDKITDGPHETPKFISEGIPFLSVDGIQNGELVFENCRKISEEAHKEYSKKALIEYDDILLGKAASIGKIARVKVDFEFSIWSPLALIKANKEVVLPIFLEYSLKTKMVQYQIETLATNNTQKNISMADIPRFILTIPPIQEQEKIANFLDIKNQRIEEFIKEKQYQIALLKEQKEAIINRAVTKGLDDSVKMKDSGIEWIGAIPEHWEVRKLKYVANFRSGEMITSEMISQEGTYKVYGGGGFRGYTSSYTNDGAYVLIGRQGALCGNIKYAKGKFWASEHSIVVYPKIEMENIFLGEILRISNLGNLSQTAAQPGIAIGQIKNVSIPIPPPQKQKAIVTYIEVEIAKIKKIISTIQKEIDLIKEYKISLISEVVTGQIKVV